VSRWVELLHLSRQVPSLASQRCYLCGHPPRPGRADATVMATIADVRGYTRFTSEHGDEAGARLAARFAEVVREQIESRGGTVVDCAVRRDSLAYSRGCRCLPLVRRHSYSILRRSVRLNTPKAGNPG
jgi:hypothetical protein